MGVSRRKRRRNRRRKSRRKLEESGSLLSLSLLGAISPSLQSVKRSAAIFQDMKGANLLFAAEIKRKGLFGP